jgi:hypothetical protein
VTILDKEEVCLLPMPRSLTSMDYSAYEETLGQSPLRISYENAWIRSGGSHWLLLLQVPEKYQGC